jgi:hypothetical protein
MVQYSYTIPSSVLFEEEGAGGVPKNIVEWPPKKKKKIPVLVLQKSTGIRFKKVVFETFYG